jgi:hypothetical protein
MIENILLATRSYVGRKAVERLEDYFPAPGEPPAT